MKVNTDAVPAPADSLRAAINAVNAGTNDGITFLGTVGTITVVAELPTITKTATIDGTGAMRRNLRITPAAGLPASSGLTFSGAGADDSKLFGVTVDGFTNDGIRLLGVKRCQIGSAQVPFGSVTVINNGTRGQDFAGIHIKGGTTDTATGNQIRACYIGTNAASAANLGNKGIGVFIEGGRTAGNFIGPGATTPDALDPLNVISGNLGDGVRITSSAQNWVFGNRIGTNRAGTAVLANGGAGVNLVNSPTNVGGIATIGSDELIRSPANLISGNGGSGVALSGTFSSGTLIYGNFIGTDVNGTAALANAGWGVQVQGVKAMGDNPAIPLDGITIGGALPGQLNVISGNTKSGITFIESNSNQVENNSIGRGPDKKNARVAVKNQLNGIEFDANSKKTVVTGNAIWNNGGAAVVDGSKENKILKDNTGVPGGNSSGGEANSIGGNGYGIDNGSLDNVPAITSAVSADGNSVAVTGTLQGPAYAKNFYLEFFGNLVAERQGDQFLGSTTLTTDTTGFASFTLTLPAAYGRFLTATATGTDEPTDFTSEFSVDRPIGYGTSTAVTSSLNPSVYGQSVTFTATVTPQAPASAGVPTGSVTFYDGGTALGTVTLDANGQASYTTALLLAGGHAITAVYNPEVDPNFATSTSAVLTQGVGKGTTGDPLQFSPGNPVVGQTITFSGYISVGTVGVAPTGTVTLTDQNGNTLASGVALDQYGYFSTDVGGLAAGSYTVTATYSGDGNYNGNSAGVVSFTVGGGGSAAVRSGGLAPSSVSLTGPAGSVSAGQAVTLTAAVTATGAAPVGWVVFYDGDIRVGTARIDGTGHVNFHLSGLRAGTHHLAAVYMGDGSHARSAAAAFTLTVR